MEKGNYNFNQLKLGSNISQGYFFEDENDKSIEELCNLIKEMIQNEEMTYLNSFYDEENYYIDVHAERNRSYILIHDDLLGISYNYVNKNYKNNSDLVEVAGYEVPQMCICEDKEVLLEIIITFLKSGKPSEKYEWLESEE